MRPFSTRGGWLRRSWGPIIGRGFDVAMAVPFYEPLSEGLRQVARRCAEACPTGALAPQAQGP
ncbi:MAG: hypothetical protein GY856_04135 [bacterium]|nr:hypothetical protein [bacterium]